MRSPRAALTPRFRAAAGPLCSPSSAEKGREPRHSRRRSTVPSVEPSSTTTISNSGAWRCPSSAERTSKSTSLRLCDGTTTENGKDTRAPSYKRIVSAASGAPAVATNRLPASGPSARAHDLGERRAFEAELGRQPGRESLAHEQRLVARIGGHDPERKTRQQLVIRPPPAPGET